MKKIGSVLVLLFLLSGCDQPVKDTGEVATSVPSSADIAKQHEPADITAPISIRLLYSVQEPNIEPYESRIIITNDYIRLDDNDDANHFVLVDRKKEIVYSVSDENNAIFVVKHAPVTITPPIKLVQDTERTPDKHSPKIDGHDIVHYIFKNNGKACQDALIAEGLMPEATKAISQYRRILAGEHAKTFNITPADQRNECDMAIHIFQPDRYLQFGLPVHERDHTGYQRNLIDFDDNYEVNPALFNLPEGFDRFSVEDLQAPSEEGPLKTS